MKSWFPVLVLNVCYPAMVQAANTLEEGKAGLLGQMVQMLVSLALVVGLMLLVAWFFRRSRLNVKQQQGQLQVLETMPLGMRDRLLLVRAGDKYLVLSATPGRIEKLAILDELPELPEAQPDEAVSFKQLLGSVLNKDQAS